MNRIYLIFILGIVCGIIQYSCKTKSKDSPKGAETERRESLRIMAYNIHHANPPSKPDSIDIAAIVRTIRAQDPDLVALQEIDGNTERSGEGNQAEIIADSLDMNVFFGKAID